MKLKQNITQLILIIAPISILTLNSPIGYAHVERPCSFCDSIRKACDRNCMRQWARVTNGREKLSGCIDKCKNDRFICDRKPYNSRCKFNPDPETWR